MRIKYPNGKRRSEDTYKVSPSNRGMAFEDSLNQTNEFYEVNGRALIRKRPTPVNVVKCDPTHPGLITKAYFEERSTTDYNGVYKGRYLDFEAKSCLSKTSFPVSNIRPQQIDHLEKVKKHGGIAFFLIDFPFISQTFLIDAGEIVTFIKQGSRASVPLSFIKEKGHRVREAYQPRFDYLEVLDEFFL